MAERFVKNDPDCDDLRKVLFRLRYDSYMWNFARLAPEQRREFVVRMYVDLRALGSGAARDDRSLFSDYQNANLRYRWSTQSASSSSSRTTPRRCARACTICWWQAPKPR